MTGKIVLVVWDDAYFVHDVEDSGGPCLVHSVGWLVSQDAREIRIAQDFASAAEGARSVLRIPRGMVRKVQVLAKVMT